MPAPYSISEQTKQQFAGIYLLEYMINAPKNFGLMLQDEEQDLEPVLEWLLVRELIEIRDESLYVPNARGRDALKRFMARYTDFLRVFDVFCAVDLAAGEFAFASYFNMSDEREWKEHLQDDRWEDLRVAVADFKGIDPVEIVFMSFLNEGRFGRNETGWQFDLLLGSVWDDILDICNRAVQVDQLGYDSGEEFIDGDTVMRDIIARGTTLIQELQAREARESGIQHAVADPREGGQIDPVGLDSNGEMDYDRFQDPDYLPDRWRSRWDL